MSKSTSDWIKGAPTNWYGQDVWYLQDNTSYTIVWRPEGYYVNSGDAVPQNDVTGPFETLDAAKVAYILIAGGSSA